MVCEFYLVDVVYDVYTYRLVQAAYQTKNKDPKHQNPGVPPTHCKIFQIIEHAHYNERFEISWKDENESEMDDWFEMIDFAMKNGFIIN